MTTPLREPRPQRTPGRRPNRDPYGLLPAGTPIAAVLAVAGLLVIAAATFVIGSGSLPFGLGGGVGNGAGASGRPEVVKTPTPSGQVVVPSPQVPGVVIPGTIAYVKGGNVWLQADGAARQLTSSGTDSMPSFSEDGAAVYFVRTRKVDGLWKLPDGTMREYRMDVPALMRIPVGGGDAAMVYDGLVDPAGRPKWMGFIQGPVVSPDGKTVAMTSDLPDPSKSDVTLKLLDLKAKKIKDLKLPQVPLLGHQDAAWRPDGLRLAYVENDRDGAKGMPQIYAYDLETGKTKAVTGPGYIHPSWSPDGRYLAATKTTQYGTDVVVLDAASGSELLRLTSDGDSWGPSWSPAGDQIAYLHVSGQVVDLRMIQLDGAAPAWKPAEPMDLTSSAGLESVSRPDWFVPADQLPASSAPAPAGSAAQ